MSGEINVISRTQQIIVEPTSRSVALINAGPYGGPPGADGVDGATGPPGAPGLVIGFAEVAQHAAAGSPASSIGCDYGYTTIGTPANNSHTVVYTKQQAASKIVCRGSAGMWGTGSNGRVQLEISCYWSPAYTNRIDQVLFMQFFNELGTWKNMAGHTTFYGLAVRQYAFRLKLQNYVVDAPGLRCGTDATAGFTVEEIM